MPEPNFVDPADLTPEARRAEIARLERWLTERDSTLTQGAMGVSEEAARALEDDYREAGQKRRRLEELKRAD